MPDPIISLFLGLALAGLGILFFWPRGGILGFIHKNRQMSDRILREDALKQVHKAERHSQVPTLEGLAGGLGISVNKAADLVADMQGGELLYLEGESIRLTPAGRRYALQVIRAHRLYERYLAHETGYGEDEWHDQADWYEHRLGPDASAELSARLGNPTHDPHGDPIPTAEGELVLHEGQPLPAMPLDQPLRIVHIEDEPEVVYAQLLAEGLYPGMQIRLLESTSRRVRFWADGDEHILAPIVAANLSMVPVQQETLEESQHGVPLSELRPGQAGEVVQLSPRIRGLERRRLMDLGILPGTRISADMSAPGGQPVAYRVRGALIALRREQADLIKITTSQEMSS
jgi:DtxR family Mn-dependent transcriptional regulator